MGHIVFAIFMQTKSFSRMKKVIYCVALIAGLFLFSAQSAQAQTKDPKQDKAKQETTKEAKTKAQKGNPSPAEKEAKSNQGNAYGKDKGDMTGKEFGQQRASDAKSKEKPGKAKPKKENE
jgi:colicin import membrane protein